MNPKTIGIFLVTILIIGLIFSGIVFFRKPVTTAALQPVPADLQVSPTSIPEISWDDPAGFIFSYAGSLSVNKHDEDQDNYAHVELTDPNHPGSIIIWVKDTTAVDVTAWIRTDKSFKDANILDTTLGGEPAKKVIPAGDNRKMITGTIFDGLLWYVEGNFGADNYWSGQYQKIIDSFTFKPILTESADNSDYSAAAADEEEVLE